SSCIARIERGVEGALAEDRAKIVGQAESNKERVRRRPCTEDGRHQHVAHETRDARHRRPEADREATAKHQGVFLWTSRASASTSGKILSATIFSPAGLGWMPSAWFSLAFIATPSSTKG